jgi:hypothetical protein
MSWHLQLKLKLGPYSSRDRKPSHSHWQPPTPVQTNNSTATGFADDTVKQKCSKAMDMRFYWIKDHVRQVQFIIYWRPGPENHSPSHHRQMRPTFLLPEPTTRPPKLNALQGCVNSPSVCTPIRHVPTHRTQNQSIQTHPIMAQRCSPH